MNERIRELAIEANLISPESNGFDPTRLSISQQKFSELIVKECADTVTDRCEMHSEYDEKRAEYYAKRIKEHFGVEE